VWNTPCVDSNRACRCPLSLNSATVKDGAYSLVSRGLRKESMSVPLVIQTSAGKHVTMAHCDHIQSSGRVSLVAGWALGLLCRGRSAQSRLSPRPDLGRPEGDAALFMQALAALSDPSSSTVTPRGSSQRCPQHGPCHQYNLHYSPDRPGRASTSYSRAGQLPQWARCKTAVKRKACSNISECPRLTSLSPSLQFLACCLPLLAC
jgi:hypothetical protein